MNESRSREKKENRSTLFGEELFKGLSLSSDEPLHETTTRFGINSSTQGPPPHSLVDQLSSHHT